MSILGWRKLGAWGLIFALCAYVAVVGQDIPVVAADLIKWVTGFFFGANALVHLGKSITVSAKE